MSATTAVTLLVYSIILIPIDSHIRLCYIDIFSPYSSIIAFFICSIYSLCGASLWIYFASSNGVSGEVSDVCNNVLEFCYNMMDTEVVSICWTILFNRLNLSRISIGWTLLFYCWKPKKSWWRTFQLVEVFFSTFWIFNLLNCFLLVDNGWCANFNFGGYFLRASCSFH